MVDQEGVEHSSHGSLMSGPGKMGSEQIGWLSLPLTSQWIPPTRCLKYESATESERRLWWLPRNSIPSGYTISHKLRESYFTNGIYNGTIARKMLEQLVISGFGGQGALFIGQLLGYAAAQGGKKVTCLPSYGPEMRGGTASCQVVISDRRITSPVFSQPTSVVALNLPSLDKFEPAIKPGGLLVVNSDMVDRKSIREDIRFCEVPANHIAEELGDSRMANLVALGGYIAISRIIKPESIIECLPKMLSGEKSRLIPANAEALKLGLKSIEFMTRVGNGTSQQRRTPKV